MKGKARTLIVFLTICIFILVIFCTQCTNLSGDDSKPDIRGEAYANPHTCVSCHKDIYNSYQHTNHFHTSSTITGNNLQADIVTSNNTFAYNDSVKVKVEKKADSLYQTVYFKNQTGRSQKFDIAFGSGEKAQTYAYWQGNRLFELPLSYFKEVHNWTNSPGFPASVAYFDRSIISRCFECHGSFADKHFVQNGSVSVAQEYDKDAIIYGIDCQRCHGPAAEHVKFQTENPDVKQAKFIASYKTLNRLQKVQMCAVCHSGNDKTLIKPAFAFKPGDDLNSFYEPFAQASNTPDVHGNQAGLLSQSKCFLTNASMTCTTCHDPHTKETNNLTAYSQKCLTCHSEANHNFCKMAPQLGASITNKCIDCHMPAMPSRLITYKQTAANHNSDYNLHTHRIAIYPEKTKEILAYLKNITPIKPLHP
jgi:nitrate/TMAO reductase-like tetraheme cytochrome c subunit